MKEFLGYLLMAILSIAMVVVLLQIHHRDKNIERCEASKYKTREFEIINNKLACKDSGKGMQILTVMELNKINRRKKGE